MKKVKKFITCIISLFVICICPYMVQADQINFGDSIEISTEYGRYKLQIDNVHEVDWDWAVEDRKEMKIVTVQCVVENLNHTGAFEEGAIANWEIGMKGILITDQDGFGLEFFNISGGDDGAYEVGAMTSVGSKKRVSLPYYAPEDCTKITVTVDGKYMLEMSLDEKNEISGENIGSEDKDSSEIDSLLKEKKNLETKNQELIDENKKLKFEKLQLQDKVQQLEVENEKIKKKMEGMPMR